MTLAAGASRAQTTVALDLGAVTLDGPLTVTLPGAEVTVPLTTDVSSLLSSIPVLPVVTVTVTGGALPLVCPAGGTPLGPPVNGALTCSFGALNALVATVGSVAPFLARRNDSVLALELGLDHAIDRFFPNENGPGWTRPALLQGLDFAEASPEVLSEGVAALSPGGHAGRFSFAASLQQARRLNASSDSRSAGAPDALGVASRPAAPRGPGAFDLWVEGYASAFDEGSGAFESVGRTGVLYAGVDYLLSPHILVGALVQYDDTEQQFDSLSTTAEAQGWMAGPYAVARMSDNLFLQVRAAWGKSDIEIDLNETFRDRFDADRWLVRGTLLGQWRTDAWEFRPRASVAYIEEAHDDYTSFLGVRIPGQTVSIGQAKAGPQIAYRHVMADGGVVEPSLLVEGIWNFEESNGLLMIDDLVSDDGARGRAEAGLTLVTADGVTIGASASYDGVGASDYKAIGGKIRVKAPIN